MPVLRASAGDATLALKRNVDSQVVGKVNPYTFTPTPVVSGKGTQFQITGMFRELYFQEPMRRPALGFLGNAGRRFPQVGL